MHRPARGRTIPCPRHAHKTDRGTFTHLTDAREAVASAFEVFIQYLEGPEQAVRTLLERISADVRHADVRVLVDTRPPARQFAEWTMGYEPVDEARTPLPAGFRSTFDDLEAVDDADAVLRATRELSLWFRVRQARRRTVPA